MRNYNIFCRYALIMVFALLAAGCSGSNAGDMVSDAAASSGPRTINIEKLEIYHFHGTQQCYSCVMVGKYAEDTVNTYFRDELEKGIIVFGHINGELQENRDVVIKYGATGSSLWLGTYGKDGSFRAEQNINVWYRINNQQGYMDYLKGVIEQKLAGN